MDWLPVYPDLLPKKRTPRPKDSVFMVPISQSVIPATDVLATKWFLPVYPHRVARKTWIDRTFITSAAWLDYIAHPLSWLPIYPAQVPKTRPARKHPSEFEPPPSVQVIIAQSMAWAPHFPDRVHRTRLQALGGVFYAIPPSVPAAAVVCLNWGLESLTTSALVDEGVTFSTLINERLTTSTLTDEEVCNA